MQDSANSVTVTESRHAPLDRYASDSEDFVLVGVRDQAAILRPIFAKSLSRSSATRW
jgi:hypothetical protein